MSWGDYIEKMIVNNEQKNHKNCCCAGAIIGLNGSIYAQGGEDFKSTAPEIVKAISGDLNQCIALNIGKTRYQVTQRSTDPFPCMYLKSTGGGACIAKAKTLVVVGIFDTNKKVKKTSGEFAQNVGDCNTAVEDCTSSLIGNNC